MLHPNRLVDQLNARQLAEWEAYFQLEPLGEQRADIRNADLMQLIANVNRNSKRKPTAYKRKDFLLDFEPEEKKQSLKEMLNMGKLWGRMRGKKNA